MTTYWSVKSDDVLVLSVRTATSMSTRMHISTIYLAASQLDLRSKSRVEVGRISTVCLASSKVAALTKLRVCGVVANGSVEDLHWRLGNHRHTDDVALVALDRGSERGCRGEKQSGEGSEDVELHGMQ